MVTVIALLITTMASMITVVKDRQNKWNDGWYEATIIIDGVKVAHGHMTNFDESKTSVKMIIDGDEYITSKNNIVIKYHKYD